MRVAPPRCSCRSSSWPARAGCHRIGAIDFCRLADRVATSERVRRVAIGDGFVFVCGEHRPRRRQGAHR